MFMFYLYIVVNDICVPQTSVALEVLAALVRELVLGYQAKICARELASVVSRCLLCSPAIELPDV